MSRGRVVIFGWADSVHVQRWAQGLAGRGFDITVISVGGEPIEGIPTIIYQRGGKLGYLRYARRAVSDTQQIKPDLVHCHYAYGFGLWTLLLKFQPTIVSVWGSDVVNISSVSRFIVRRALSLATAITATGEFLRGAVADLLPTASAKTVVIPFGVTPPEQIEPLPAGPVRLCFLKEHRAIYGPDILIEAFALARRQIQDLRLTLAGSGDMMEQLRRRIDSLGLSDAVEFPGFIERSQLVSFLSSHHILVMPSRMESFGVAALEASVCARPVIATKVGGIPEVVRDGRTGVLVPAGEIEPLAEAIVRLAGDRNEMTRLGLAGYQFVKEKYRWEDNLDQMCDLYDRLIRDAKKNPVL
ncbi:MAG: glycosyltransferase [candidate division Zixibacteria bacterium]|nr:glycosyltransferase [candidate division Zixibacteria bacterium]